MGTGAVGRGYAALPKTGALLACLVSGLFSSIEAPPVLWKSPPGLKSVHVCSQSR